jgi:hypothetical protein
MYAHTHTICIYITINYHYMDYNYVNYLYMDDKLWVLTTYYGAVYVIT